MGSVVHIFCSDTARIGKTLLARVFADLSVLRHKDNPVIFDTDLSGNGIINYFPTKTTMIDLTQVGDQIAMFDTMMALDGMAVDRMATDGRRDLGGENHPAPDYIVDVGAGELMRFFDLFNDIGFERGAREAKLDIRIYYLVNWSMKSLQKIEEIQSGLSKSKFFSVRNMGVQAFAFTPQAHEVDQVPEIDISVFLNALSPDVFGMVNEKAFSFARFISGEYKDLKPGAKTEIWNFLEEIYNHTNCKASV